MTLMARKNRSMTKRQKQDRELRQMAMKGPFQYSDTCYLIGADPDDGNNAGFTDIDHPIRWTRNSIDETDNQDVRGLIDGQHCRAIVNSLQTASQFGWGVYDVDFVLKPSDNAVNRDNTEPTIGQISTHWIQPTPLRVEALRDLKKLETLDDNYSVVADLENGVGFGNEVPGLNPEANPLLSIEIDENETDTTAEQRPIKGSKIIRFGFGDTYPVVARQSAFTMNLNPNIDTDVLDSWEKQFYVLFGGSNHHFGILERKEASVNPYRDGHRFVQHEWRFPMNNEKVVGVSRQSQPLSWTLSQEGIFADVGLDATEFASGGHEVVVAKFRGIMALGGLIGFTVPDLLSEGIDLNNDFDLYVNVRCRRWESMA